MTEPTYGGRPPTSHERQAGQPWDASYQDGPAPWDIGAPQPIVVRLAAEGAFAGAVLDAGCGTGDNGLHIAALGLPVLGFDVAETAVAMAREKAAARGIEAEFVVADALALEGLGRRFDTVLDSALFHTFDGDERGRYVDGLAAVTRSGRDRPPLLLRRHRSRSRPRRPASGRPGRAARGVRRRRRLAGRVASEPERVETRFAPDGAPAWLARIDRL